MTRKEIERIVRQEQVLVSLGFTTEEAYKLRRISMTLQRWFEHECGNSNDYGSWAIERDDNGDGPPFMVHHHYRHGQGKDTVTRTPIADRETGAKKRLQYIIHCRNCRITAGSNGEEPAAISSYIQGDPRGAALYIIRPGDVPAGANVDSYYSRGICVY